MKGRDDLLTHNARAKARALAAKNTTGGERLAPAWWTAARAQALEKDLANLLMWLDMMDPTAPEPARRSDREIWRWRVHHWANAYNSTADAYTARTELVAAIAGGDPAESAWCGFEAGAKVAKAWQSMFYALETTQYHRRLSNRGRHSPLTEAERLAVGEVAYQTLLKHQSQGISPNDAKARAYAAAYQWGLAQYPGRMPKRTCNCPSRYLRDYLRTHALDDPSR